MRLTSSIEPEAGARDAGHDGRLAVLAVGVAAAVSVAAIVVAYLFPLAATDTLCRYAPMAEAFASGDWAEAFHPRFAVGGTVVAGLFALLPGFDGLTACTVGATLVAVVIYFICPQPLIWALKGLREPFKMLGLLLMVDAVVRVKDRDLASFAEACAGVVFLCLFKCDAILLALVLGLAYAVGDGFARRTWALTAWGAVVLQPMCWLVWQWTGYWLPAPHYVPLWKGLFGA